MVRTTAIAEIEEEAARRISALDPSRHRQAALEADWHESPEPFTSVNDTSGATHLAFTASVEDAPFADDGSGYAGTTLTLSCDLVVVFMYRIPARSGVAAQRLASVAALDIVSALLDGWGWATVWPVKAYKPGPIVNGFMPVQCRFSVQIDTALRRS